MNHVKGQEFYNIQNTNVYIKFSAHDADARVFSSIKNEQKYTWLYKGNNKITELRTILQRESQNSQLYKQTK